MNSKTIANGILRAILIIVGVLLIFFFLYKIKAILIYIILGSITSLIGRRVVIFFNTKLKIPNTLAVIVTMILFMGIFSLFILLFVPLIIEQSHNLSRLNINQVQTNIQNLFSQINLYFESKGINLLNKYQHFDILSLFNFGSITSMFNVVTGFLGSITIGLLATLFISFFMLKDGEMLDKIIFTIVPTSQENKAQISWLKIKDLLSRYFTGLAIQVTVLFILYFILLSIFSIKNALVIALICALLNLIPYVGPIVNFFLIAGLTITSNLGLDFKTQILPITMYVLIGFILIQVIDNFINQPLIFSKSVKSHPLEIFLVILIGGTLFGIIGMVVAVPIYTVLKVVSKEFLSKNKIVKSLTKNI